MRRNRPGVMSVALLGACFVLVATVAGIGSDAAFGQASASAPSAQPPPPLLHSRLITADEALAAFASRFHPRAGTVTADPKPDWYGSGPAYCIRGLQSASQPGDPNHGWVCALDGSIQTAGFNWPQQTRTADPGDPTRPISPEQGLKIALNFVSHTYPDFARRDWFAPTLHITQEDVGTRYYFQWCPVVGLSHAISWPPLEASVDPWTGNIITYSEPDRGAFVPPAPPLVTRESAMKLVQEYAPADPRTVPTIVTLWCGRDDQGGTYLYYTVQQNVDPRPRETWLGTLEIDAYNGHMWYPGGSLSGTGAPTGPTLRKPLPTKPLISIPGVTPVPTTSTGPDGKPIKSADGVVQVAGAYYIRAEAFRALGARVTLDAKLVELAGNGFSRKPPLLTARKIYGGWWVEVLSTAKLLGWPGSYDAKTNTLHVESDPVSFKNPFKLVP